jgi:hypothetical protein
MAEQEEFDKIADFFAEVKINFNFEEQLSSINEQLRVFARSVAPITVPLRIAPISSAQIEMATLSASSLVEPRAKRLISSRPRVDDWETREDIRRLSQGYVRGDGGWYKPSGSQNAVATASLASSQSSGESSIGLLRGMAPWLAGFGALDVIRKGSDFNRQIAALRTIVPGNELQPTITNIIQSANQNGIDVSKNLHSFIPFANAAAQQGIDVNQASGLFNSVSTAIAATGSQNQSSRIFSDIRSMLLNTDKVSFSQLQRSDPGRYLNLPGLLEQQFNTKDIEKLTEEFNKLSKSAQIAAVETALNNAYQGQAAAAADTTAGSLTRLKNNTGLLGATLEKLGGKNARAGIEALNDLVVSLGLAAQTKVVQDLPDTVRDTGLLNIFGPGIVAQKRLNDSRDSNYYYRHITPQTIAPMVRSDYVEGMANRSINGSQTQIPLKIDINLHNASDHLIKASSKSPGVNTRVRQ